ncbi:hypothetical protein CALVIDRAFT_555822 [Calocera viscosa TUFC12733]|uniref:Sodium/calcium exchanger membrane region domain-containing protein n=1 Tax=Calocera viscosa (strain TUFC12733) TaxID=1330018 RepID=A0A167KX89_CALVF|nr:hypothetical protein CALVIDRAFT_555822 [Calocera viscosa TUFC12733]
MAALRSLISSVNHGLNVFMLKIHRYGVSLPLFINLVLLIALVPAGWGAYFSGKGAITVFVFIGSILSNLLLVLGMCCGIRFYEQGFQIAPSQLSSELLLLGAIAILVPGVYKLALQAVPAADPTVGTSASTSSLAPAILSISRGIAWCLVAIYIGLMWFTLLSHSKMVNATSPVSEAYPEGTPRPLRSLARACSSSVQSVRDRLRKRSGENRDAAGRDIEMNIQSTSELSGPVDGETNENKVATPTEHLATGDRRLGDRLQSEVRLADSNVDDNVPIWKRVWHFFVLGCLTAMVYATSNFLVSSFDGVTASGKISKQFIGLILLPIAGNAAEHVTAVTVAIKDKLDMSVAVAVGSAIQISQLVIPVVVLIAWAIGKPLPMLFDPFSSALLFFAVLLVNHTMADAKSNWMEGMVLIMFYVIIAVSYWYYPGYDAAASIGLTC